MKLYREDDKLFCATFPNFDVESFFLEHKKEYRIHNSHEHQEVAINCPSCTENGEPTPDQNQKLWINMEKGRFYCYRCQWRGNLVGLVMKLQNCPKDTAMQMLKGTSLDPLDHLNLTLNIEKYDLEEDYDEELREVELPYGYEPLMKQHPYLEKRGIPWQYADRNDFGIGVAGHVKDRIIVPMYVDDRLVFWQARATWDEPDNKKFKKVLNPSGVSARNILYNYDVAKRFEEIILVEGFTDAIKVGPDAVATNSKVLQPIQVEYLKDSKAKSIVIMWDLDAWTDGKKRKDKRSSVDKAADYLKSFGFKVKGAKLPKGRDPGSFKYRSSTLRKLISKAETL